MKPYLFPFTWLSAADMAVCRRFFQGVSVFQFSNNLLPPDMQAWIDQGLMEMHLPDPSTRLSFEAALAETENWAQSHRLGAASYAKGYPQKIPFFDASSVSQIRQDIRSIDQPSPADDTQENALMTARIFLQMAQAFDTQNQVIRHELDQQEARQRSLYQELRGDALFSRPDRNTNPDDPAQFMLLDRLKAWSRIWLAGSDPQSLLVTTHPSVLSLVQEYLGAKESLIHAATVPVIDSESEAASTQRQALWSLLHKLAQTDRVGVRESGLLDGYPVSQSEPGGMQIYFLPGLTPDALFVRFADRSAVNEQKLRGDENSINTVIALVIADDDNS